ncbi:MAG: hypothetical protein FWE69_00910 [Clostridiales bacterium]|nr:hypothetical protein [Clostridiales bacterium]
MIDLLLLSKDTPIAKIINGDLQPILPERLPLFLQRIGDIDGWLCSRAIDNHRTNSRLLKKALRLQNRDDLTAVLSVNAATITDNYWVKPLGDTATSYADVRFSVNRFDNLALTGDVNSFHQDPSRTPELTNTGSFEKCWRLYDGQWWMIKAGKPEELFSELLIYRIGKLLGFPMAEYEPEGAFIKSRDFTQGANVDFEPAVSIVGDTPDYIKIYDALKPYGEHITDAYLQMCYLDALVLNLDRHEHNFGVLRDSDTGAVISLAPFFDHNIALVSRNYPHVVNDQLIRDFVELVRYTGKPMKVRELTRAELQKLVFGIPWEPPVRDGTTNPKAFVVQYLLARQAQIKELCRETIHFQPVRQKERDERER